MSSSAQSGSPTDPASGRSSTATIDRSTDRSTDRGQPGAARPAAGGRPATGVVSLDSDTGSTRIGDGVVAKIAGLAARDIPGVFSMGSAMSRRVGQLRSLIPGGTEAATQGVSVEVGEREAAIDINLVTWYGQSIVDVSEAVRSNVASQVEGMTGLRVIEVNIQVDDVHVETPGVDTNQADQGQRVQ